MTETTSLTAIIPNHASSLYPTYGVDIVTTIEPGQDMQPVEWIEIGNFPTDDHTPEEESTILDALQEEADNQAAAKGWSIKWDLGQDVGEHTEYPVERI